MTAGDGAGYLGCAQYLTDACGVFTVRGDAKRLIEVKKNRTEGPVVSEFLYLILDEKCKV